MRRLLEEEAMLFCILLGFFYGFIQINSKLFLSLMNIVLFSFVQQNVCKPQQLHFISMTRFLKPYLVGTFCLSNGINICIPDMLFLPNNTTLVEFLVLIYFALSVIGLVFPNTHTHSAMRSELSIWRPSL